MYNLPDDVTPADIDRAAHRDDCPECGSPTGQYGCNYCDPEDRDPDRVYDDHG